ncbi:MAG: FHA domain-containing protein [Prevotella sp.]|nr:FHA domain-containing protein [Prevotella sp.]
MNEKITMSVKCPNPKCNASINFQKKLNRQAIDFSCPQCKKKIHVDFDISTNPQSYKAVIVDVKGEAKTGEIKEEPSKVKKDTVYVRNKNIHQTPRNSSVDWDYEEEREKPVHLRRRKRLKEKVYLTHIKFMGLVKEKYRLSEGKTTVGRYDEDMPSDISLKGDNTISRQSLVINIEADDYGFDYKMKVVNATNAVRVNDRRIKEGEEISLEFGDVIKLGNSKLNFNNK